MTELLEPARMQPREAKSLVPASRGETLGQPAEAAGEPAEVLQPVLARPDLEPVDDDLEVSKRTRGQDGEQGRVERRRLDDVVAPAVEHQMAEDAQTETNLSADATPPVHVELHPRSHGNDLDVRHVGTRVRIPLEQCQIRDLDPAGREAFGEVPIPALGAANSVRIEAVEDEADAHGSRKVYRALRRSRGEASTLLTLVRALVESFPAAQDERIVTVRRLAIVPALNEGPTIARVVEEIRSFDPGFEILVVDDGSTDGTRSEAERAGARVVRLPYNIGIGAAVQTGYQYARDHGFQVAVQVDGDGQHDPGELRRLLEPLAADDADMVVGSRFREESLYRAPFMRRLGIRLLAGIVTVIIRQRMTDPTSGFRGVNRRGIILFAADYPHDYPEAEANVLAFRHRLRIVEVPVSMRSREAGRSSITALGSLYYMIKVSLALFISVFRRYRALEER